MLKYTNKEHTTAALGAAHFAISAPAAWDSIGDGPTREAVLAWIAAGNAALPFTEPDYKALKWDQIKVERDRRKAGGVNVQTGSDALGAPIYKWFHTDADSRIQQLGLVQFGASVPPVQWKTMDGSFVAMTQTLANAIFQAVANADQAIFSKAEEHKAAMEASADPTNYNFLTGWPLIYGE